MLASPAVLAAALVALVATPALADEVNPAARTMIARIGSDTAAFTGAASSQARILEAVIPERAPIDVVSHATGTVTVEIVLNENGGLVRSDVFASSGRPSLDRSALDAVRRSRFAPARIDGKPVPGTYAVTVIFDPAE